MPAFGTKSRENLSSCHPNLQRLFNAVIARWDCTVLEGYRTPERQAKLFEAGDTKVRWGRHNENPSKAVDVAPYPIDWKNVQRFYRFAEYVRGVADAMGIRILLGADWDGDTDIRDQRFNDLVHFELL